MTAATTLLLVEDDLAIAQTIVYALTREQFEVVHCTLAGDALAHWQKNIPALTILDIGLPDGNGLQLCQQLRQISSAPILFLSARSDEVDRVLGFELGADDYLCKPFSPRELCARVKAILRRSQAPETTLLPRSGLQHDEARASIVFQGSVLPLTLYEYRLLKHLLAQPERVYSREQLLDALGAGAENSGDRAIDTLIKQLRAKLRACGVAESCIHTHRGLGYSLQAPA